MLKITSSGSTSQTERFLERMIHGDIYDNLTAYAERGLAALRAATPLESGETAASWDYEITFEAGKVDIWWVNNHIVNGFNVAIGLQYGHGTGTGGYVAGQDYINKALRPIFDEIADGVWKEVQSA
jgi:hypothetical protein